MMAAPRDSLDFVREFHETYKQPIANEPNVHNQKLNRLRIALLDEELEELAAALRKGDAIEALDALTDIQYVLDGAYLALGFHRFKEAALAEVHRSNMSKLGTNGEPVYREDGKIIKGPNYSRPNLSAVLSAEDKP